VIVTPLIDTVGSVEALKAPIVSTGPPPSMIVPLAPAPLIVTLTSIVTPPAYVPGKIMIVSPSLAALTAAWIVEKQPGLLPTQMELVFAADAAALAPPTAIASPTTTATRPTKGIAVGFETS
jgi:hypothetical protein